MTVRSPGFGRPRQDGRQRVRAQLLDTALRLFSEYGYIGVRVEDIAKEAGVSRATFYKHFAERAGDPGRTVRPVGFDNPVAASDLRRRGRLVAVMPTAGTH